MLLPSSPQNEKIRVTLCQNAAGSVVEDQNSSLDMCRHSVGVEVNAKIPDDRNRQNVSGPNSDRRSRDLMLTTAGRAPTKGLES